MADQEDPMSWTGRAWRGVRMWMVDRKGATMVVWAIMAIPVLSMVGASVDYARFHSGQVEMQNAVDAAALAGGRAYENTLGGFSERDAAARQAAQDFFDANFPDLI
ncbi:MAG: hypothetical protein GC201_07880 [Alphaproteobacteria bacterium]|nr:hypothetical protein [Alphaproteobacteria bacterium]